jgi:cytidine deaminase
MKQDKIEITYRVFDNINEMESPDAWLLNEAREVTSSAYAPYSNFHVGAVAKMANGKIVAGSNQENASYPAGLCAERVLLSSASMLYPDVPVETIAISYNNTNGNSKQPISPCGICRQSLSEYENRFNKPIRLILGGMEGPIYLFERAGHLLPLAFSSQDLLRGGNNGL